MQTYLAVIHLERSESVFVIRSPDFPEVEVRCKSFDDTLTAAQRVIRSQLQNLRSRGATLPKATSKESLENRPEYRQCFLIGVDAHEESDPSS